MALFALVLDGTIVQSAAATFEVAAPLAWTSDISAVSPEPQVGWTATEMSGAWTYAAPAAPPTPPVTPASAYGAFIAGGLTLTSTGTPALDGVYPIDQQSQSDIATEAQFVSTFGEFTNGGTINLAWFQANESAVSFPTSATFMAFAKGAAQAVAAAKLALGQGSTIMPSPTIVIS